MKAGGRSINYRNSDTIIGVRGRIGTNRCDGWGQSEDQCAGQPFKWSKK